jgi:SAM-dependent methyltransferase
MACLLCHTEAAPTLFYQSRHHCFFFCSNCDTVYRDPSTFLDPESEKARYLEHNNDPGDKGYQQFVQPIVKAVKAGFKPGTHGLDFGAGTGPVIAKLLSESGYRITLYDPFFHPNASALDGPYDFIVACEVIEHFHRPLEEFIKLRQLLKPGGILYCMTDPIDNRQNFAKWYYKDDPTHVVFYNRKNLEWIASKAGYSDLVIDGRLIVLHN